MPPLIMRYSSPAADSVEGWESESLPIGCGHFGANIFGIPARERIQITENSLENDGDRGGLNNFAELYLHFPHKQETNYERSLCLDDGTARCRYTCNGVEFEREYFTSYPDRVLAVRLTASRAGALAFELAPEIPFVKDYAIKPGDGGGKTGTVSAAGNRITLSGEMLYYKVLFEGILEVKTDGKVATHTASISVTGASWATVLFTACTNYVLKSEIFTEHDPKKKLEPVNPHHKALEIINTASALSYDQLREKHVADYRHIFARVSFALEGMDNHSDLCVDQLLKRYRNGEEIPYLEALYFQFGRYLLISSSRKGALPATLQGVWNCHDQSPWGSGYWHNINVQMNYWPAFLTNCSECFQAYSDFNMAFRNEAERLASDYIKHANPENFHDQLGECGWTIGTASYAYTIYGPGGHSGPGTGALTTKLFWDYYDFTRDPDILRRITYPTLLSQAKFLTRTVRHYDGFYLASFSASPEQMICGQWQPHGHYYNTVGCAFDQQMIWENGADLLRCAEILGTTNDTLRIQRAQQDHYHPVEIGLSGQIKEYAEENFYGEIGEYKHRHISQLVALYPGTLVNKTTPAWLDAAKDTLNFRGDESTGWALAHRMNAWARTGDGTRTHRLLRNLLGTRTLTNLWDTHPPFQIDGNFGGTSGMAEMLLQSHEGYIAPLAALPPVWQSGTYRGLCARGGFEVSATWQAGRASRIEILSKAGGVCRLFYKGIRGAQLTGGDRKIAYVTETPDRISFETEAGGLYVIEDLPAFHQAVAPSDLHVDRDTLTLTWQGSNALFYNIYRAAGSAPSYEPIAQGVKGFEWRDTGFDFAAHSVVRYKVCAIRDGQAESEGVCAVINHATQLELERYAHQVRQNNL